MFAIQIPTVIFQFSFFFAKVYGETSFSAMCDILNKLGPISEETKFVDLGSGIGQLVLQVAALTKCQVILGIEYGLTPSTFAKVSAAGLSKWTKYSGDLHNHVTG